MEKFLHDPEVLQHPDQHAALVHEMRLEALIATTNSPYAIVRAVAPVTDDPDMPALTLRAWIIGLVYACIGAFVNQLFVFRNPPVSLSVSTAQLLACMCQPVDTTDLRPRWQAVREDPPRLGLHHRWQASLAQPGPLQPQGAHVSQRREDQ